MINREKNNLNDYLILNLPSASNTEIRDKISQILQTFGTQINLNTLGFRLCNPLLIQRVLTTGTDRDKNSDSSTVPSYENQPEIVTWTHTARSFFNSENQTDYKFYPNLENMNIAIIFTNQTILNSSI